MEKEEHKHQEALPSESQEGRLSLITSRPKFHHAVDQGYNIQCCPKKDVPAKKRAISPARRTGSCVNGSVVLQTLAGIVEKNLTTRPDQREGKHIEYL